MTMLSQGFRAAACAALALVVLSGGAIAQDRAPANQPGLLDNLFSRGEPSTPPRNSRPRAQAQAVDADPADESELAMRIGRLENALRQLTGQIEQLQYRNQQLEQQLSRMQGGAPVAAQTPAAPPVQAAPPTYATPPASQPVGPTVRPGTSPTALPPAAGTGRRGDAFDPSQNPAAPGVPRSLGGGEVVAAAPPPQAEEPPIGAPGGRAAGAPLDLSTVSGGTAAPSAIRTIPTPGSQVATLPPTQSPKDQFDLAYGYVLHKDYALAEKAFRSFIEQYPNERLVPDAQYWLGETLFQRQRYQDAADVFLVVVRNHETSGKAPDALLRLGQSLHAIGQKEMACASLGEVERKFPRASAGVKRSVAAEQKRAHC